MHMNQISVYLLTDGVCASKEGGRLILRKDGEQRESLPLRLIDSVVAGRQTQISTQALFALIQAGASVFYMDRRGRIVGHMGQGIPPDRLLRQIDCLREDHMGLLLARKMIKEKLRGQRMVLLRFTQRGRTERVVQVCRALQNSRKEAERALSVSELMGIEGRAARMYFSAFSELLQATPFSWPGRSGRGAADPVNGLLNYSYSFLEKEVRIAAAAARLDGRIGFLHANNGRKDSLIYDLMEPFRARISDRLVLTAVRRGLIGERDFSLDGGICCLMEQGRKAWISLYESYMGRPLQEIGGVSPREWVRAEIKRTARLIFERHAEPDTSAGEGGGPA